AGLGPLALLATTVNVYEVPFVNPPTVAVVAPAAAEAVAPPGDAVTVYPVIALPPSEAGAVQCSSAERRAGGAGTPAGGPGTPVGVTALEGADAAPGPLALPATTVNVYDVPFAKPPTVALVAPAAADTVAPPGDAVTVYPVIALPPSEAGAVQC